MKQKYCVYLVAFVLLAGNVLANPESSKEKSPTSPAELLVFLTGTTWQLQSGVGQYFGEGTVVFLDKGVAEHIYKDGVMHKKHWGVTADMKLIWGGKYMQLCRFSPDFKTFMNSLNHTTGRRALRPDPSGAKVTVKE